MKVKEQHGNKFIIHGSYIDVHDNDVVNIITTDDEVVVQADEIHLTESAMHIRRV